MIQSSSPLPSGTVVAVSLSPRHGFSKQPQSSIRLLAGLGVEGDAHCGATVQHLYLKRKNPSALNRMQVHLLASELLEELNGKGYVIGPGDLGENILTSGIDLLTLPQGTLLHLGDQAVVDLTCLRQPCKQIDRFEGGLQREMYTNVAGGPRYRVGVMGIVLQSGDVYCGDSILPVEPEKPHSQLTV